MKNYRIKAALILSSEDKETLKNLPDNLPTIKLSKKQIDQVNALYYKYISKNQIHQGWSRELFEIELKEKWPSGPRVKRHEAKRFILNNLLWINDEKHKMTITEAAAMFFNNLTSRESFTVLLYKGYELI